MIEKPTAQPDVVIDPEHGRQGRNGNWPGCTKQFVNRVKKDRKKANAARKARRKNRK